MANTFTLPEEDRDHSKDRARILFTALILAAVIFGTDLVIPAGVAEAVL